MTGLTFATVHAVLFDLDETLMVEEPAAVAAFQATAEHAASRYALDVAGLAVGARAKARSLWRAAPTYGYCLRVGISSWEGLWCRFEGTGPETRQLHAWSSKYRRQAWALALIDQGIEDDQLASELGERFVAERRARFEVFPEVPAALQRLSRSHRLGLVTNGASCLQREKLEASGLGDHFDVVVVSDDFGVGKPDSALFREAAAKLGAGEAVMVGDSIEKDVAGALAAGLQAVWVNRSGRPRPEGLANVPEVATLDDLSVALAKLG